MSKEEDSGTGFRIKDPEAFAHNLARVIEERNFVSLQEMLKHWTPPTAASALEALPVEQQVVAFRVLPRDLAADVFEYLPLEAQERLLKAMAKEEVAKILNEMAPDDRTALLDELPATVTQQLLQLLTPEERAAYDGRRMELKHALARALDARRQHV